MGTKYWAVLFTGVVNAFLMGWLWMLWLPSLVGWHPSYWAMVILTYLVTNTVQTGAYLASEKSKAWEEKHG